MTGRTEHVVDVFVDQAAGGNPAPVVLDAVGMRDDEMLDVARRTGRESAFITSTDPLALTFFTPQHEMTMCGHASIGVLWLLRRTERIGDGSIRFHARAGEQEATVQGETVWLRQRAGTPEPLTDEARSAILAALRLDPTDLASPMTNIASSRAKTLVTLPSPAAVNAATPDFDRIKDVSDAARTSGIYLVASDSTGEYEARQFPRDSGFPEDPATGTAAAALALHLRQVGALGEDTITVHQGRAMGTPCRIRARVDRDGTAWVTGDVRTHPHPLERTAT